MQWKEIGFLGSFQNVKECPATQMPEFAFIGRSNVGKSSLINMLLRRKEVARTSKTPGKTQSINLFNVDETWTLADLPGYGYAQASKTSRKRWQQMIEGYLQARQQLICTFVLIDIRHPLQKNDKEFLDWMGMKGIPFLLVFTKSDKLKQAEKKVKMDVILQELGKYWEPLPQYFLSSAMTGEGGEEINNFVHQLILQLRDQGRVYHG